MAILVDRNSIYAKIRGRYGDVIVRQYKYGTVISQRPDMSNVKPSMLQKHQRSQFTKFSPLYQQFIRQAGNREMLEKEMLAAGKHRMFQFFISKYCSGAVKRGETGWVMSEREVENQIENAPHKSVCSTGNFENLPDRQACLRDRASTESGNQSESECESKCEIENLIDGERGGSSLFAGVHLPDQILKDLIVLLRQAGMNSDGTSLLPTGGFEICAITCRGDLSIFYFTRRLSHAEA